MAPFSSLSITTPLPALLLLLLFVCITSSSSDLPLSSFPVPVWRPAHLQTLTKRDTMSYLPSFQVNVTLPHPRQYSERLDLELVQSATTWLHVRWQLQNKTGATVGVPRFSRVRCHIGNTTTIEHDIQGSGTQYRIPNLSSNTQYVICVETMEMSENYLHYRCAPFRTIPLVRPDSVLGLLLTLGYILLMGMMGYVTWCMRMRRYISSRKAGNEVELSCRTSTIRCSEIEERVQLNSHSGAANSKTFQPYTGQL